MITWEDGAASNLDITGIWTQL